MNGQVRVESNLMIDETLPHPVEPHAPQQQTEPTPARAPRRRRGCGCGVLFVALTLLVVLAAYFLLPFRTNVLLLGVDQRPEEGGPSRTDSMILTTFLPAEPYLGMLSIPRDLWVSIPGVGENRINTAHFFAEAEAPGTGPGAAKEVVVANFGVDVPYFALIHFDGVSQVVDALGGVTIRLDVQQAGYGVGDHRLDGGQALAFVRDRSRSDDFFRMARTQILLQGLLEEVAKPSTWVRLPAASAAVLEAVDSDLPFWLWPRLGVTLLRVGPGGVDARVLNRDFVQGFTGPGGAQVLAPDWSVINPVLLEMFGQ